MKKFFSVLLSIIFALCLLATIVLSVVRSNLNTSTITEFATQIFKVSKAPVTEYEDDGLFHPNQKIITYAQYNPSEFGDFDLSSIDISNMDINEIVQTYLADYDVDPAIVSEILSSPEITETVSQYADEIINYMTGETQELTIDPSSLTKVVNTAIDKYEAATGEVVDRTGLDEAISTNVEAMVPELTATLDSAKEENAEAFELLRKVNLVLSLKVFIIAICVCLVLALIILLINRNVFVWFKYISIPMMVDGLILFLAAIVAKGMVPGILSGVITDNGLSNSLYTVLWNYIRKILFDLKVYGIVATLLGVALCVLGFMLGKKNTVAAPAEQTAPVSQNNSAE
ncbi:MAG: hypothetical protein K5907_00300 [Treponema sp.]|nr:hypothetical protein [Treponema sp.]